MTYPRRRSRSRHLALKGLVLTCLTIFAGAVSCGGLLWLADRTPREWAAELQRQAAQRGPIIHPLLTAASTWLTRADRLARAEPPPLPALLGASAGRSLPVQAGSRHVVGSVDALADAVAAAHPGDVVELQPGRYRLRGRGIRFTQPGSAASPITLRAARLGDAVIESDTVEAFKVVAPFWHFENLSMVGVCVDHTDCEHAIHVAGGATDTQIRNGRFEDFNAQIKINGEAGAWPDRGIIAGNTFADSVPRMTRNPVTPIDLVGASRWRVSGNVIADFVRGIDGATTYGAFFKGAGQDNVFQGNFVVCEWTLSRATGSPQGSHVGFSLGGGGTDLAARRDAGRSGFEQVGGVIRNNLIAFCSDDGIYLNRAARSVIDHNTLLDTAGVDGRYLETSATMTANIIDGAVRGRDGGVIRGWDNDYPFLLGLFVGLHPQRGLYRDPGAFDLTWRASPARVAGEMQEPDLCGQPRGKAAPAGAFGDFSACVAGQ